MKTKTNPLLSSLSILPSQRPSLRRDLGFWRLTIGAHHAILKHEQGLSYVAWLLAHPGESIHGLALALKIRALRNGHALSSSELIQERALALDDAEAARSLFKKQQQLEALLEDDNESEPIKQEAIRDLQVIYSFQTKNLSRTTTVAQKASDSVGRAIKRLHQKLLNTVDCHGQPHSLFCLFADFLKHHILIPSGRGIGRGGCRVQGCEAGSFIYQPQASSKNFNNFSDLSINGQALSTYTGEDRKSD